MGEELKECPFCGYKTNLKYDRVADIEFIDCQNCNAIVHFGCGLTAREVADRYNTRVSAEAEAPLKSHRVSKKRGKEDDRE